MSTQNGSGKLYDSTFLIGGLRRKSEIKKLFNSTAREDFDALISALNQNHPDTGAILGGFKKLNSQTQADKVAWLWAGFAQTPRTDLAQILSKLGWPQSRKAEGKTLSALLAVSNNKDTTIRAAIHIFIKAIPVNDVASNDEIYKAWLRTQDQNLEKIIIEQKRHPSDPVLEALHALTTGAMQRYQSLQDREGLLLVKAYALAPPAFRDRISLTINVFAKSIPVNDAAGNDEIYKAWLRTQDQNLEKIIIEQKRHPSDTGLVWLWEEFAQTPRTDLAQILSKLGWPDGRKAEGKTQRALLTAANNKDTRLLQAVHVFAKAIPVNDETGNEEIYKAWLRTQDQGLEKIITDQKRHPSDPVFEALHALTTGAIQRYQSLQDRDGLLLVKAYALAPPNFRDRIGQTVVSNTDRDLKLAYRRAMSGEGLTNEQRISNLIAVNDHEGLFELSRHLLLSEVLVICEHWSRQAPQFEHASQKHASQKAVCERAIKAYQTLGTFQIEAGPKLPDGLEDIFAYWRRQNPSDADLKNDLKDEDPFLKARGLYLGYERNLVDPAAVAAAANNDHWPLRMTARLLDPALMQKAANDHVLWVSACAGDAGLLNAKIDGTPEDYKRHSSQLNKASTPAATRMRSLLEILCAFQGAFIASGITADEIIEASDKTAISTEDADDVDFD